MFRFFILRIFAYISCVLSVLFTQIQLLSQTVQFSTNPPPNGGGVVMLCTGSSITFTNTSTNIAPGSEYLWSFPGANPSSASGIGPHSISYTSAGNYTATLTVDGQSASTQVNVIDGPSPFLAMGAGSNFSNGIFNNQPHFLSCDGSSASFLSLSSNSTGTDANTVHTITWGNGQPDFVFTGTNFLFHPVNTNSSTFYTPGSYTVTYTINNGVCISTSSQPAYSGTPPGGIIQNINQVQSFCIPGNVIYEINPQANGPGTNYEIVFNDGSNSTYSFVHPPPSFIAHEFPQNSCGSVSTFDGTTYFNSFSVTMNTSNPCGQSTSGIAPIIISEMPAADFIISDTVVCVNAPVTFTNASFGGTNVTGGITFNAAGCDTLADVIWTHTPLANVNLLDGDLGTVFVTPIGSQWFPGTEMIVLSFSEPGTYVITLLVRNKPQCGVDTITKTICVLPELIADFSLADSSACAPYLFDPDNLSNSVDCENANVFQWSITRTNPQNCPYGSNPGYQFINGTDANSFEPQIQFTAAGIYEIQLINSLEIPVPGVLCQGDTIVKTLIIKDIPYIALDSMAVCEGSSYTLIPPTSDCYADNGLAYNWNFAPSTASINTSNLANPTLSYSGMGQFTYSVTATNECGQLTSSAPIFVEAGISISAFGPLTDCINSPMQLTGLLSGGVTTGSWTSDLPSGTFIPSANVLNPMFNFPNGYVGDITFVFASDPSPNGCPPAFDSLTVNINSTIFANAGIYNPICINTPLNLQGSFGGLASAVVWSSLGGGTFSNTANPNAVFTPPLDFVGNITLVLTTNDPPGDCQADVDTVVISIVPLPVVEAFSDTTICEGQSMVINATGAVSYSWDQGLGSGGSHTIAPITTTTYTVVGTDVFGCQNTDAITVNVLPAPDINPISDFIYCPDENSTEIIFTSSFPNTLFNWSRTPQNIGLSNVNGIGNISSFLTTNSSNDLITSIFSVTPEAANCPGQTITFNITVNPTPQITNSASQTICPGPSNEVIWTSNLSSGLNVAYEWQLISIGPNLSGATNSGQGNLPSMTIVNSGNTTEEIIYEVVYQFDDCFGAPFYYSIFVNPGPVMDPIPSQEICSGTPFNQVDFSASVIGTNFSWTLTNANVPLFINGYPQPSGFDFIPGNTVSNTSVDPYILIYEVTPNALGCSGIPETFELIVNPELTASTNLPTQFVCNNTPSEPVSLFANVANSSVSWSVYNLPPEILGVNQMNGSDLIPGFSLSNLNPTTILDVIFALVPLNQDPTFCPGDTTFYNISVFPTPVVNPLNDSIFCSGSLTDAVIISGNATNYAWSHNGGNIGLIASGDNDIPSFTIINNETTQIETVFTVIPQVIFNNAVCEGISANFTFTINPTGQINALPDLVVCVGDSVPQVNFSTQLQDGQMTYSWTNSNTNIGLVSSGNDELIPSFLGMNSGSTVISSQIEVIPTYTNNGLSCDGDAEYFNISINPIPEIVYIADTFICNSQVLNITPITNINADFVWQGSPNAQVNGISNTTQLSGGIDDFLENISPSAQIVNYTIAPVAPGTGCIGDTSYIQVIVEPSIFMTSPTVYEICSGTTVNSVLSSNVPVSYTWFATPNPNVTGATTFAVNTGVIQDTLINTSQTPQMVVYTVIPSTLSGNCQGNPLIVNVLVNPELQVTTPSPFSICNNGSINIPLTANANGIFSWFATQNGQVFGETTQIQNTNSINDQLFNNSSIVQTVTYNVVVTSADLGCSSQNFELDVHVLPTPSLNTIDDITVCNTSVNGAFSPVGTYNQLNWTNNNTNTGIAAFANNALDFAGYTATNSNNFPINSNIIITPIYAFNQTICSGNSTSFNITVNPLGQVNFIPNIEVCHNTPIPETLVSTSNLTGVTAFTWENDNLNTGLNLSSGQGNIPNFTGVNSFSANPIVSNISVIASYVNNNVACASQPNVFQIIVNPIPVLDFIPNLSFCNGDDVPGYNFSGPGTNHYVWSHNNIAISMPLNGFGNLPQFVANNGTYNSIQSTVEVNSFYNSQISNLSCPGSSQQFTITIQPSPFVSFTTDASVYCSRNSVAFYNYSGPNVSFNWNFGDGNTSFVTNPFHEYSAAGTYNVILTGTNNATGCVGSFTLPLSILETPIASFSVDSAMQCFPAIFNFTDNIQAPFTITTWHFGDGLNAIQNDSIQHVYADFGCFDVTLYVASENGCMDSLTVPNMVCHYPQPIAYFEPDQLEYNASNPIALFYNLSQNASSYLWNFGDSNTSTAINPVHIYPDVEGGYAIVLTAFNEIGCSDQHGVFIKVIEDKIFYVPNAFTPQNKDGVNDLFLPVITSGFSKEDFQLIIYNRWGEIVYRTNDVLAGWDGNNSDAQPCPDGTYIWELTLRGILDEDARVYRGHIVLLR